MMEGWGHAMRARDTVVTAVRTILVLVLLTSSVLADLFRASPAVAEPDSVAGRVAKTFDKAGDLDLYLGALAAASPVSRPAAIPLGLAGAFNKTISVLVSCFDPPVGTARFQPDLLTTERAPIVIPPHVILSDDPLRVNPLFEDLSRIRGLLRTLKITANRLYTAIQQGQSAAAESQRAYMTETLFPELQSATASADAKLASLSQTIPDVSLTSAEIQALVRQRNATGPSEEQRDLADRLAADKVERTGIGSPTDPNVFSTQPAYSVRGDALPTFRQALQQLTPALREDIPFFPTTLVADSTLPTIRLTRQGTNAAGKSFVEFTVQDTGVGLSAVGLLKTVNLTADISPPSSDPTGPITITATKIEQDSPSSIGFAAADRTCNCQAMDPVFTRVTREPGKPERQTFNDLPQAESKVMVTNGAPGVRILVIDVNGKQAAMLRLRDRETKNLSIASSMLPGNKNVVTLTTLGPLGGSADVVISD
jgi:hypothetical protein